MKSFKKLRNFAWQGGKGREKPSSNDGVESVDGGLVEPTLESEFIAKGMEDIRGAQKKYEVLANLSAEVSSCAHGLSTAVQEMASYFGNPGVLDDHSQDIARVFKLVGSVQSEISKSLELYASHVTQTVTTPTENLIAELQNVQETKQQYDVKRQSLDSHRTRLARGRSRSGRVDNQDEEQLEDVREQFEEVSRFLGDRLSSLRQGRSQRLITQAARHHAAQMRLFSKGLISLHDIEPHIKQVTQELNIDRDLSSIAMDDSEAEDDALSYLDIMNDNGHYFYDIDGEHEHRYSRDDLGSGSSDNGGNTMLNMSQEWSSFVPSTSDKTGTLGNEGLDSPLPQWLIKGSKSTPTSPLPIDDDIVRANNIMPTNSPVQKRTTKMGVPMNMFDSCDHSLSIRPMPLPLPMCPPLVLNDEDPLSSTPRDAISTNDISKKRYSYSGPLISGKPTKSHASIVPSSGPLFPSTGKTWQSLESPKQPFSSRSSLATSPKLSPPHMRELYKLPPPPLSATSSPIVSDLVSHSAPLRRNETNISYTKKWIWT